MNYRFYNPNYGLADALEDVFFPFRDVGTDFFAIFVRHKRGAFGKNGRRTGFTPPAGRFYAKAEITPYELDAGNTDERTCS